MKEEELFDPLIDYLAGQGYEIIEQHRGHEHGIDIIASKNGRRFLVELKGDSTAPDVDFGTLVYQIIKEIKPATDSDYAIAVSEKYTKYVDRCKFSLQKLGIQVYSINKEGVNILIQ